MRSIKLALFLLTIVVLPSCSVSVPPPAVKIEVASTTVLVGDLVTFQAVVSGVESPYTITWVSSTGNTGSRSIYRETFPFAGKYSVLLTVRYPYQRSLSARVTILVKERDDGSDDDNGNDNDGGGNENDNDHGDNENDNQGQDNQNDNDSGGNENDNDAGNHNNNDDGNGNQNGNGNGNENQNRNENDNESGDPPTVDLKVNGSDQTLLIVDDDPVFVDVSWTSTNSDRCEAFGSSDWEGLKADQGTETVGPLTEGVYLFSLICENDHGADADAVFVEVRRETPPITIEIIDPDDDPNGEHPLCCVDMPINVAVQVTGGGGRYNFHFLLPDGEVFVIGDGPTFEFEHRFPFEIQGGWIAVEAIDVDSGEESNRAAIRIWVKPQE